jgi:hypothetical protein
MPVDQPMVAVDRHCVSHRPHYTATFAQLAADAQVADG